ncbi:MAG: hypothetical protein RLZZ579_1240 [Actinomycetota bacterium]|jgi:hypothetical protein
MFTRNLIGKVLTILALPVVFLGLIDPLEGGLALIVATLIYVLAFWLLKKSTQPMALDSFPCNPGDWRRHHSAGSFRRPGGAVWTASTTSDCWAMALSGRRFGRFGWSSGDHQAGVLSS